MSKRASFPATFKKACHVKFAVLVLGWTQTQAAIVVGLNSGTVSKIINGLRFPASKPMPF